MASAQDPLQVRLKDGPGLRGGLYPETPPTETVGGQEGSPGPRVRLEDEITGAGQEQDEVADEVDGLRRIELPRLVRSGEDHVRRIAPARVPALLGGAHPPPLRHLPSPNEGSSGVASPVHRARIVGQAVYPGVLPAEDVDELMAVKWARAMEDAGVEKRVGTSRLDPHNLEAVGEELLEGGDRPSRHRPLAVEDNLSGGLEKTGGHASEP